MLERIRLPLVSAIATV